MAAHLYSGVKSLQLVLDKPYDAIRTADVRNDLVSIKVWVSLTSGFNPNNGEGLLVPSGNSLNVTIPGLLPSTRYYVKYAFISAIDDDEEDPAGPGGPGSYTVSSELSALVYDDSVTVYGYLTNDPVPIVTKADGTGGDFTNATGSFKVFNLNSEVTGIGPVYAIKADSIDSITGATIDAVTGVYSCTGLTDDGGNVTFTATYNEITVEQVWNVYRAKAGETAPLVQLSTTNKEFIYKDEFATSSLTASTTITARLVNLSGSPVFTAVAYTRAGVSLGNIAFTQNANVITITKAQFDALGVTTGSVRVTATVGTVSDVITINRINNGTEQITVELSNEAHVIPAYSDGTTTASSYVGSGTTIKVKEGNTYLSVDNSVPIDNASWRVTTIDDVNIVCDTTPGVGTNFIEFNEHSTMDDNADVAYIDYTIVGKTTSGVDFTIVKRQSFAKSKEGAQGATARSVAITSPSQLFITAKNSTTPAPNSITLTAVQSNFITPQYTWYIQNPSTLAWEAPGTQGTATNNTFVLNKFAAVGSKAVKVVVTETIGIDIYTVYDIFSVYSLREGDDSFIAGLSNENQTISYDSGGQPNTGQFPITSTLYAALGTTFLSPTTTPPVVFAKESYNGGGTCTINTAANTPVGGQPAGYIKIEEPLTIDSATAVFSATIYAGTANEKKITKSLTLNKSKDGQPGAPATAYWLTMSAAAIKKTSSNTFSPATITATAYTSIGVTTPGPYLGRFKIYENGSATASYTSAVNESTTTWTPSNSNVTSVKVELYLAGGTTTKVDEQFIPVVVDGSSTVTGFLSNDSVTLSANSEGVISSFNGATTTMSVFIGAVNDSTNWTYSVAKSNVTCSEATNSRTQTITALTDTTGYVDITASKSGYDSITKRFSVNKVNSGQPGTAGASNHRAYIATANSTTAPTWTAGTTTQSGAAPSGWSLTPVTLSAGQAQWQVDGTTPAGSTTTAWSTPYPSYFKVDTLEAVTTNTGNLTVTGTIKVGSTASTTNGILISPDSISIYNAGVLRVKLGSI